MRDYFCKHANLTVVIDRARCIDCGTLMGWDPLKVTPTPTEICPHVNVTNFTAAGRVVCKDCGSVL